jgi:hypothetical protein
MVSFKKTAELQVTTYVTLVFFAVALRTNGNHGLIILEDFRSHTTTHHSR